MGPSIIYLQEIKVYLMKIMVIIVFLLFFVLHHFLQNYRLLKVSLGGL